MADEAFTFSVDDDGSSKVVKRDLEDIADTAATASTSLQGLQDILRATANALPNAGTSTESMRELAGASDSLRESISGSEQSIAGQLLTMQRSAEAAAQAESELRNLEAAEKAMEEAADGAAEATNLLEQAMSLLGRALAGFSLFKIAEEALQMMDAFQGLTNRLQGVTSSAGNLVAVQEELFQIGLDTEQSTKDTTELFVKLSNAMVDTGRSQQQMIDTTREINLALKLTGKESSAAQAQIIQLFSGVGRFPIAALAREAPEMLKAIGDGIEKDAELMNKLGLSGQVTLKDLKRLGTEGKLSADIMATALHNSVEQLEVAAAEVKPSIMQAIGDFGDSIAQTVGKFGQESGLVRAVADTFDFLTANFDTVAKTIQAAGIAALIVFAPAVVTAMGLATTATLAWAASLLATPVGWLGMIASAIGLLVAFGDQLSASADGLTTFGDYFRAVWGMIVDTVMTVIEYITGAWGALTAWLSASFGTVPSDVMKFLNDLLVNIRKWINFTIGVFIAFGKSIPDVLSNLPKAIAELFFNALNAAVKLVQDGVNAIIGALNSLPLIPDIDPVLFQQLKNDYAGAAQEIGELVTQNFASATQADYIGMVLDGPLKSLQDRAEEEGRKRRAAADLAAQQNKIDTATTPSVPTKETGKSRDSIIKELNDELDRKNQLRGLLGQEAAIKETLLNLDKKLVEAEKDKLGPKEIELLTAKIKATQDIIQLDAARNDLYNRTVKVQDELVVSQKALNQGFAEGWVTASQYTKELQQLELAGLELADTVESRVAAAFKTLDIEAGETGAKLQTAIVDTYRSIKAPAEDMARNQEAINILFREGKISADEYGTAMNRLKIDEAADRISRGVGTMKDSFDIFLRQNTEAVKNWSSNLGTMFTDVFTKIEDGIANSIGRAIVYSDSLAESLQSVAKDALAQVISALVKMGIQWAIQAAFGQSLQATLTATSAAQAATLAADWGPAATAVSLATAGLNSVGAIAGISATAAALQDAMTASAAPFADGGLFKGSGGPRDDSNIIKISNGEYIVNAKATANNLALLEAINAGKDPTESLSGAMLYALGGLVGDRRQPTRDPKLLGQAAAAQSNPQVASQGGTLKIEIDVTVNGDSKDSEELGDEIVKQLMPKLAPIVDSRIAVQQRPGGLLANKKGTI